MIFAFSLLQLPGALDIIKNRPHLLLNAALEIDWEIMITMYPKWVVRNGSLFEFTDQGRELLIPERVMGVLLKPDLGQDDLNFIGSQVNCISQSVIPNTIYDDLAHVQMVISLFKAYLDTHSAVDKKKFSVNGAFEYYTQTRGRPPVIQFRTFQKLASVLGSFEQHMPLIMECCSTYFGGRGLTKVNE